MRAAITLILTLLWSTTLVVGQFGQGKLVYHNLNLPYSVATGDLDGDGDVDVVSSSRELEWVKNDGSGNFGLPIRFPNEGPDFKAKSIISLDYDKDGDQDVIAVDDFLGRVNLWKNLGGGVFQNPQTLLSSATSVVAVTLYSVDFDRDGDHDVFVCRTGGQNDLLTNKYPLDSWEAATHLASIGPSMDVADINHDGNLDIVSINQGGVYMNGTTITPGVFFNGEWLYVKLSDLDRDDDLDVVVFGHSNDKIVWLKNENGNFSMQTIATTENLDYYAAQVFDFDDDGDDDIIASCFFWCGTDLYENQGGGVFTKTSLAIGGAVNRYEMVVDKINGDPHLDLIKTNQASRVIVWYANNYPPFTGIESNFYFTGGVCNGDSVFFKHQARGKNIVSWRWSFGDGFESNLRHPSHLYKTPGTYTVTLTVTNQSGATASRAKVVTIKSPPDPIPDTTIRYCSDFIDIQLDPTHNYNWVNPNDLERPYWTRTSFRHYHVHPDTTREYFVFTLDETGCRSEQISTITTIKYFTPSHPTVVGATSDEGPAELVLNASVPVRAGERIFWFEPGNPTSVHVGTKLTREFETTTEFYVQAVNEIGCASPKVPVVAAVWNEPNIPPKVLWADITESNTWTEGNGVSVNPNGKVLAWGQYGSGNVISGGVTLPDGNSSLNKFLIEYNQNGESQKLLRFVSEGETSSLGIPLLKQDNLGNYYMSANLNGNPKIGGREISGVNTPIIVKLSTTGQYIWHYLFRSGGEISSIQINAANELVVTCNYFSQVQVKKFNPQGNILTESQINLPRQVIQAEVDEDGTFYTLSYEGTTLFLSAFNSTGTQKWTHIITEQLMQFGIKKLLITDRGIVVAGMVSGDAYRVFGRELGGGSATFILQVDFDGNLKWLLRSVGLVLINELFTSNGSVYFTAVQSPRAASLGAIPLPVFGNYIFMIDSEGRPRWVKRMSSNHIRLWAVANDKEELFVNGYFVDFMTVDGFNLYSRTNTPFVDYNIFTAKIGHEFRSNFSHRGSCAQQEVSFKDLSTAQNGTTIDAWSWDFGDGATSQLRNPKHTFSASGQYLVRLVVRNNLGSESTFSKLLTVNVQPQATISLRSSLPLCQGDLAVVSSESEHDAYEWSTGANTPEIQVSSDISAITLRVRDKNGCWSEPSPEYPLVFHDRPNKPIIQVSPSFDICQGTQAILSTNSFTFYEWSNGSSNSSISVEQAGKFGVRVANVIGCWSVFSDSIHVNVLSPPSSLLQFDGKDLIPPDGLSHRWFRDNVFVEESAGAYTPLSSGTYQVETTATNGCTSISNSVVVVITGLEPNADFAIYPNPAVDEITVQSKDNSKLILEVKSANGIQILKTGFESEVTLKCTDWANGVYIILLYTPEGITRSYRISKVTNK